MYSAHPSLKSVSDDICNIFVILMPTFMVLLLRQTWFIWWTRAPGGCRLLDQVSQLEPTYPSLCSYSDYIHHLMLSVECENAVWHFVKVIFGHGIILSDRWLLNHVSIFLLFISCLHVVWYISDFASPAMWDHTVIHFPPGSGESLSS